MLTYQVEPWSQCLPEMMALWSSHWAEVGANNDKLDLDPDLGRYADMERKDALHVITARKGGELVGYYVWIVGPMLHHRTVKVAMSDMYWLRPDCRRWFGGIRFMKEAERYVKSLGVKKLFATFQPCRDLSRIYERLGWAQSERVFCKFIGT